MARLTIRLSDVMHRALREAAARTGKGMGELVEESLAAYGVKTEASAAELVARARARSSLGADEAMAIALRETRAARSRATR